jgi:hypothetical protein
MHQTVRKGVTIVVVSMLALGSWTVWFGSRSWTPLEPIPISLSKGSHYTSPQLSISFSDQYAIDIQVDNKLDTKILRCQLGSGSPQQPCNPPSRFEVHWTLSGDGNHLEGTNTSQGLGELNDGPKVSSVYFAVFKLRKGQNYRLDLDVLSDSGTLNVTNPRLSVEEFGTAYEFFLLVSELLRFLCFGFAIIGTLIALWGVYDGQRERAM